MQDGRRKTIAHIQSIYMEGINKDTNITKMKHKQK